MAQKLNLDDIMNIVGGGLQFAQNRGVQKRLRNIATSPAIDPFGSERPQYQNMLSDLVGGSGLDPASLPGFNESLDFALDKVKRQQAAKGQFRSGNTLEALTETAMSRAYQAYLTRLELLKQLSGANQKPQPGAAVNAEALAGTQNRGQRSGLAGVSRGLQGLLNFISPEEIIASATVTANPEIAKAAEQAIGLDPAVPSSPTGGAEASAGEPTKQVSEGVARGVAPPSEIVAQILADNILQPSEFTGVGDEVINTILGTGMDPSGFTPASPGTLGSVKGPSAQSLIDEGFVEPQRLGGPAAEELAGPALNEIGSVSQAMVQPPGPGQFDPISPEATFEDTGIRLSDAASSAFSGPASQSVVAPPGPGQTAPISPDATFQSANFSAPGTGAVTPFSGPAASSVVAPPGTGQFAPISPEATFQSAPGVTSPGTGSLPSIPSSPANTIPNMFAEPTPLVGGMELAGTVPPGPVQGPLANEIVSTPASAYAESFGGITGGAVAEPAGIAAANAGQVPASLSGGGLGAEASAAIPVGGALPTGLSMGGSTLGLGAASPSSVAPGAGFAADAGAGLAGKIGASAPLALAGLLAGNILGHFKTKSAREDAWNQFRQQIPNMPVSTVGDFTGHAFSLGDNTYLTDPEGGLFLDPNSGTLQQFDILEGKMGPLSASVATQKTLKGEDKNVRPYTKGGDILKSTIGRATDYFGSAPTGSQSILDQALKDTLARQQQYDSAFSLDPKTGQQRVNDQYSLLAALQGVSRSNIRERMERGN